MRKKKNNISNNKVALVLTMIIIISFSAGYVSSFINPTTGVGHDAEDIGPGIFAGGVLGEWTFPDKVNIQNGGLDVTDDVTVTGMISSSVDSSCKLLPTYVGKTSTSYTGGQGGYSGANAICNLDFPGSHVCSAEEILRTMYCTGSTLEIPNTGNQGGWFNAGTYSLGISNLKIHDCDGWTTSGAGAAGHRWQNNGAGWRAGDQNCAVKFPFLCCMTQG